MANENKTENKPVAVVNKPVAIFGAAIISRPKSANVFEQRGGGRSTTAAIVTVPLVHAGVQLDMNIYARFDKPGEPVRFEAALPRGASIVDGPDAEMFEDRIKGHAETAFNSWSGGPSAMSAAYERLTGVKSTPTDAASMRPRLVFKPADKPAAPAGA